MGCLVGTSSGPASLTTHRRSSIRTVDMSGEKRSIHSFQFTGADAKHSVLQGVHLVPGAAVPFVSVPAGVVGCLLLPTGPEGISTDRSSLLSPILQSVTGGSAASVQG